MKFLLLFLFLSVNCFAGDGSKQSTNIVGLGGIYSASQPPNLTVAETNTQGYVTLIANTNGNATGGNYFPFYKNGVLYQVPAGSSFHVTRFCYTSHATGEAVQLVTATATFAINAASLTGGVYMFGTATANGGYLQNGIVSADVPMCWDFPYTFAASTWPGFQAEGGATSYSMYVTGRETTP